MNSLKLSVDDLGSRFIDPHCSSTVRLQHQIPDVGRLVFACPPDKRRLRSRRILTSMGNTVFALVDQKSPSPSIMGFRRVGYQS